MKNIKNRIALRWALCLQTDWRSITHFKLYLVDDIKSLLVFPLELSEYQTSYIRNGYHSSFTANGNCMKQKKGCFFIVHFVKQSILYHVVFSPYERSLVLDFYQISGRFSISRRSFNGMCNKSTILSDWKKGSLAI